MFFPILNALIEKQLKASMLYDFILRTVGICETWSGFEETLQFHPSHFRQHVT